MNDERLFRLRAALERVETGVQAILYGPAPPDIMAALAVIQMDLTSVLLISAEISREALDKVVPND